MLSPESQGTLSLWWTLGSRAYEVGDSTKQL